MTTCIAAETGRPAQPGGALLRIDDNADDLLLFELAWEKIGVANPVRCVTCRKDAVDYLEGHGKFADRNAFPLPAIIVTDMRLPDGNASEFVRWIRAHPEHNGIVVIVLSGTAHQEEVNEAYRSGANSFLLKSPNPRQLHNIVSLIQYYWLNQNFPPGPLLAGRSFSL
jgi:CheY-like chemotaxis protein